MEVIRCFSRPKKAIKIVIPCHSLSATLRLFELIQFAQSVLGYFGGFVVLVTIRQCLSIGFHRIKLTNYMHTDVHHSTFSSMDKHKIPS